MDLAFFDTYGTYFMGLGVVLVLIGLLTWGSQRLLRIGFRSGKRRRETVLRILSAIQLDPKRRVVAFEFNRRKHLVLLGVSSEIVIESEDLMAPQLQPQPQLQPHSMSDAPQTKEESSTAAAPAPFPGMVSERKEASPPPTFSPAYRHDPLIVEPTLYPSPRPVDPPPRSHEETLGPRPLRPQESPPPPPLPKELRP